MSLSVAELVAKVEISGDIDAKNKLNSVSDTVDKTSHGFKSLLGNALSFAAGGAIEQGMGFLKDQLGGVFEESMDAQAGLAQTVEVLKSTHDASGMTAQGILDLATQYSHLTKFSDDTVQASENMLLTFTNIGHNVFPQATKTVLDMSQALGQDTKSSAIQLGKALNDPIAGISALSRVGVTFDDQQKNLIKTYMAHNQVAKAQGVILKELQKEFGGSAEAAGKTFGGQLVILNQYLDDVKQNIGDAIIPVLARLLGAALPLISAFVDFSGVAINDTIDAVQKLGTWLETLTIPLFTFARELVTSAASHFTDLANTLKTPLHDAFDKTQTILNKQVVPAFQDLGTLVSGKVHTSIVDLTPVTLSLAHTFQNDLSVGVKDAGVALATTSNWMHSTGIPAYESFAGVVKDKLGGAYRQLSQDAQDAARHMAEVVGSKVKDVVSGVAAHAPALPKLDLGNLAGGGALSSIKKDLDELASIPLAIQGTFNTIGSFFSGLGTSVQIVWSATLKPVFDLLGEFANRITLDWGKDWPVIEKQVKEFIKNIEQTLLGLLNEFMPDFSGTWKIDWQKFVDEAIDIFFLMLPKMTGFMLQISANVFNWLGGLVLMGRHAWARFLESMSAFGADFESGAQQLWYGVADAFRTGINEVIGLVNGFLNSINSIGVDVGPVHIHPYVPAIPYLASGGMISQGGWAMVGEKGPERVYLPQGAQVYPNSGGAGSGAQPTIIVHPPPMMLDGHRLTMAQLPYIANAIRYGMGSGGI